MMLTGLLVLIVNMLFISKVISEECEKFGLCCLGYHWDEALGTCIRCRIGFSGKSCELKCPYPTYGLDCQHVCGCDRNDCSFEHGCVTSCRSGYFGPRCMKNCPFPTYGKDCQQTCRCKSSACDPEEGCKDVEEGWYITNQSTLVPSDLPFRVDFTSASLNSKDLHVHASTETGVTNSTAVDVTSTKTGVTSDTPTKNSKNENESTVIVFSKNVLIIIVLTNAVIILLCSMFLSCFCYRRKWNVQNAPSDFQENTSFCSRKIVRYPSQTQPRSMQNFQDSPGPETTGRFDTDNRSPMATFVTTQEKRCEIRMYENDYDIYQEPPQEGNETEIYLTVV